MTSSICAIARVLSSTPRSCISNGKPNGAAANCESKPVMNNSQRLKHRRISADYGDFADGVKEKATVAVTSFAQESGVEVLIHTAFSRVIGSQKNPNAKVN